MKVYVFSIGFTGCFSSMKIEGEKDDSSIVHDESSSSLIGSAGCFSILPLIPVHLLLEPREERRKRAWSLKEQGWRQKDIAVALGVSEGAVSQWLKRGRAGGIEALKAHPPTGVSPRLSVEQKVQIPILLAKGAEAYGFRGDVWTASRVAEVIARTFGVRYHRDHVGRLMREANWSRQQPIERATQRDEVAIKDWYEQPSSEGVPLPIHLSYRDIVRTLEDLNEARQCWQSAVSWLEQLTQHEPLEPAQRDAAQQFLEQATEQVQRFWALLCEVQETRMVPLPISARRMVS